MSQVIVEVDGSLHGIVDTLKLLPLPSRIGTMRYRAIADGNEADPVSDDVVSWRTSGGDNEASPMVIELMTTAAADRVLDALGLPIPAPKPKPKPEPALTPLEAAQRVVDLLKPAEGWVIRSEPTETWRTEDYCSNGTCQYKALFVVAERDSDKGELWVTAEWGQWLEDMIGAGDPNWRPDPDNYDLEMWA